MDLPLLVPQFRILLFFAIAGTVQGFVSIFILTRGGPGMTTYIPALQMYMRILDGDFGYASAVGVILFPIISSRPSSCSAAPQRRRGRRIGRRGLRYGHLRTGTMAHGGGSAWRRFRGGLGTGLHYGVLVVFLFLTFFIFALMISLAAALDHDLPRVLGLAVAGLLGQLPDGDDRPDPSAIRPWWSPGSRSWAS